MDIDSRGIEPVVGPLGNVSDVWAYGSIARGEAIQGSDADILVVFQGEIPQNPVVERALEEAFSVQQSVSDLSWYAQRGLCRLIKEGSLFAWHLRLEGQELWSRSGFLRTELERIEPYEGHAEDLRILSAALADLEAEATGTERSAVFDAGVLGTVIRNVGIIMTHFEGQVDFSPEAPMRLAGASAAPCPFAPDGYGLMLAARRASERGRPAPHVAAEEVRAWVSQARKWLDLCLEAVACG